MAIPITAATTVRMATRTPMIELPMLNKNKIMRQSMATAVVLSGVLTCAGVHAQQPQEGPAQGWQISPSIYTSVLVTDNINLTNDDLKVDDTSYEISPGLLLSRIGPRWTFNSNYQMQARRFSSTSENDQVFHNLNLSSNFVAVPERLGVTVSSNIQQQLIDRAGGFGATTASRAANLTDVNTYAIEPYYTFDLGPATSGRVSYRAGLIEFDTPQLTDTKDKRIAASFATRPLDARWSVGGAISSSNVEYDTGRDVTLDRYSVDLGYTVSPKAELVLTFGEDSNDLGALPFAGETDGTFWLAGVLGQLNETTSYEIRAGEQFFRDSYLVDFQRTKGRLAINVVYNESATTFGTQQIDYQGLLDFFSDVGGLNLPNQTQDVFVSKRLTAGFIYTLPKSSWRLNVFNDSRDFITSLDGSADDSGGGATLGWDWQASARGRLTLTANWQKIQLRATGEQPEDLRLGLSWRQEVSRRAYVDLRLIYNQRDSPDELLNFEESSAILGFGIEL